MARIKLDLPETFTFSAELPIRIYDINYGSHLGNDAVLRLMHEARMQWFRQYGLGELDIDGIGLVISDAVIVYQSQGLYGDVLTIGMAAADLGRYGCDFFYRISNKDTGMEVARAKTGIVFFDYSIRKVAAVPERFRKAFFPGNIAENKSEAQK
ncbi:MAG: acyl-CoA thioesterase [Desulfococcaceae bacterium]